MQARENAVYDPGTVFSGYIVSVVPLLAGGYSPGEEARIRIKGHAERIGSPSYGLWWVWATNYKVFQSSGIPITEKTCGHSIAPWTTHDYADDVVDISLGPMPETPIQGYVELWAGEPGGSPSVLVDTKNFLVPLYGVSPEKEFPWKWVAVGSGIVIAAAIIIETLRRRR